MVSLFPNIGKYFSLLQKQGREKGGDSNLEEEKGERVNKVIKFWSYQ